MSRKVTDEDVRRKARELQVAALRNLGRSAEADDVELREALLCILSDPEFERQLTVRKMAVRFPTLTDPADYIETDRST